MIPHDAVGAADVYKAGVLAGMMWRIGDEVTFEYVAGYDGPPLASTVPVGARATGSRMQAPPFFAGLLPEGESRRRMLARALHVSEDDELGLLIHLGADTVGDVQIVEAGAPLPADDDNHVQQPGDFSGVRFSQLWCLTTRQSAMPSPACSPRSRSTPGRWSGGGAGRVIVRHSPDDAWHGPPSSRWTAGCRSPTTPGFVSMRSPPPSGWPAWVPTAASGHCPAAAEGEARRAPHCRHQEGACRPPRRF